MAPGNSSLIEGSAHLLLLSLILTAPKPRSEQALENLALPQQLAILSRRYRRPRFQRSDRVFPRNDPWSIHIAAPNPGDHTQLGQHDRCRRP